MVKVTLYACPTLEGLQPREKLDSSGLENFHGFREVSNLCYLAKYQKSCQHCLKPWHLLHVRWYPLLDILSRKPNRMC